MEHISKERFKYARLFVDGTGEYVTDSSRDDLIMGPETARRYEENSDDCAVTVCCITYNHHDYIRQALDSFVMQKTNFKFKVFVGEDCGPDDTADIVREYAEKYPDIIVPFIREQNMGAQTNLVDLCMRANSPYIAFCEGDDYWIDEYKLQKQFDYMQEHEDVRMCYTRTKIDAPADWHLNNWYKHEANGDMIIPECTPGFRSKPFYRITDFIITFPNHTSSAFYRWDYDIEIPDWYFQGMIGDTPMTIMQMGLGKAVYLPDVTSVYRRSDVGVFMNSSTNEHFINTRLDYVRLLAGLREYFRVHFDNYAFKLFRWRTTKEITNYLNTAKSLQDESLIVRLAEEYPNELFEALHTYIGAFNIYSVLQKKLPGDALYHLYKTKRASKFALPGLKLYSRLSKVIAKLKKYINKSVSLLRSYRAYWNYTKVEKENDLWVFSGFRHNSYMDNTKYLYEYILENHPEIRAVWLTTNNTVLGALQTEGKPAYLMGSPEGKDLLSKASVAVVDHFAMTDFNPQFGFNDKIKVVQLWHGVGFKSMGDASGVKNTTERGVQYCDDILVLPGDGLFARFKKKIKYRFLAPFREKFEKYFLFVCPGQERLDMIADVWKIPHENCFMAGHPRNLPLYESEIQTDPYKIMFAPTYRFNYKFERDLVDGVLDELDVIQARMEELNAEFYLRLHPHTWRNYSNLIKRKLKDHDRIFLHDEKDVYTDLGTFSVVISDYSSIALDFAMLDRPVIFHCPDYEWFCENEAGFNLDFPSVIPGPMTASWEETLNEVASYIAEPSKDAEKRREKCAYFFDSAVNGPDNSERIVKELKQRLGIN
ncbi:MAG: CDP-glycerol glycerophosphotransferase family protein [Oscillospiraceae bacterium]|nr:CDP-glycerol glycerophosphotransferase family protein [Oscillospiraceae bacterium]